MRYILRIALLIGISLSHCLNGFSQKKKDELQYQPIPLANVEEAFPVALMILEDNYGVSISGMDWGKKEITSMNYNYRKVLGEFRFKFMITIDSDNVLDVYASNVQTTSADGGWMDYMVEKRERAIVAQFIEELRKNLQDPAIITKAQSRFYTDLNVNALFFDTATKVAGDRWFENFIKDRPVKWKLSFVELSKNNSKEFDYEYLENYAISVEFVSGDQSKFYVKRYTNSDTNVLTRKGSSVIVDGTCLALNYTNSFSIILVE
ncbi:hypothetical protein GCM10009119_11010 [Algoriphagus jejuensis]|uniref:Lipoprotein n=1 Tax=Algoriphagus jejuensis TaxID=419934 RepID=A0ABN1MXD4_9BACT